MQLLKIDGGQKSGSGTIVRYSVGLAALLGKDLELTNIRAKRENPGLRAQHAAAVNAIADLCGGSIEGANVGSNTIVFRPRGAISGGTFNWDIGTSGSTTMLAFTLLTAVPFAKTPFTCRVSGGLFQDFAPSAFHMQYALLPILRRMGIEAEIKIIRPGYVPAGGGIIELSVTPLKHALTPVQLTDQGKIDKIEGIAISSHLQDRKVSDRMANECRRILADAGYHSSIQAIYDSSAVQSGAALAVFAASDSNCIIGADRAGALGRTSEAIGRSVARNLLEDLSTGATVDRFLADQLILFAALAEGRSFYRIPRMTEHVETNLWLVKTVLGVKTRINQDLVVEIEGIGLSGQRPLVEHRKVAV